MFDVLIVSPIFQDKKLLARHRLVNETLKEEIEKVHAFSQVNPEIRSFVSWFMLSLLGLVLEIIHP